MKRIFLFLITNLAVMAVLSVAASLLGVNRYLTGSGLNLPILLGYAAVFGFGGAFISLLISKPMAKWTMGVRVIQGNEGQDEAWLMNEVSMMANTLGIKVPDVGIYDAQEMNAFATGATKNSSLVAVSSGLLSQMDRRQVRAVLAHEMSHVSNGDMVTSTLLMGVLNTFVIFAARVIAWGIDQALGSKNNDQNRSSGLFYGLISFVLEMVLGVLASMVVAMHSRSREFEADKGAARLTSPTDMASALRRLSGSVAPEMPDRLKTFGIQHAQEGHSVFRFFATHPPIEVRIAALEAMQ